VAKLLDRLRCHFV